MQQLHYVKRANLSDNNEVSHSKQIGERNIHKLSCAPVCSYQISHTYTKPSSQEEFLPRTDRTRVDCLFPLASC
ncbi:hypothetical protein Peur_044977 [Populus x canadensis]